MPGGVGGNRRCQRSAWHDASSARFKDEIKPMDKASEAILSLKPVTFRYKKELDPDGIPQFGLVAEQVEKVNPDLVARDEARQALHRALRSGERDVAQRVPQRAPQGGGQLDKQQRSHQLTQLQAALKAQAAQIQKVSDQLKTQVLLRGVATMM